jgi:hypothetical protein
LKVSPITTHELDRWAVETCGLPARVVHYARAQGWSVVGDLRRMSGEEWAAQPGIGTVSAQAVQDFFSFCDQLVAGRVSFTGVREVFERFANEEERAVLLRRYGLLRADAGISRKFMTLQEIGNDLNLTRERVRQIEEGARHRLRGRLVQQCLVPFYDKALDLIQSRDGLLDAQDREEMRGQGWLSGYAPGPVLLLLHDLDPAYCVVCRDRFAVPPLTMWQAAERAALAFLETVTAPVAIEVLHAAIGSAAVPVPPVALGKWLDGHPQVAATIDGRYFLHQKGGETFVLELVADDPEPIHYRTLTGRMNARLKSESRKGPRHTLSLLTHSPRFRKAGPGLYAAR